WSSDVCSSDLVAGRRREQVQPAGDGATGRAVALRPPVHRRAAAGALPRPAGTRAGALRRCRRRRYRRPDTMTYLLALDQGTSSSRSIVFDAAGRIVAMAQRELPQIYPQPGWVEHDPMEIWQG